MILNYLIYCPTSYKSSIYRELKHFNSHKLPGPLGWSDVPFDWYSGGGGFDPWSGHVFHRDLAMK